ncbi:heme-binding protein [Zeimonas arvi]|uniref:Heme-binding protein n=2 Tax=Zeimonas arvi TaxID=2498847 RepID=A0A5C8NSI5_9BURK|nr:heme-binding protein [Zeimonas arvi]
MKSSHSRGSAIAVASLAFGLAAVVLPQGAAAQGLFATRSLTLETATKAAQAALDSCRKAGYQVGVAVVDRAGVPQVFLRDRFAGAHTVSVAVDKAWTAASFRIPTTDLGNETQAGKAMSGIRNTPRVMAIGGGLPIEAAGSTVGAIGVSGAPGGEADDACAKAGIDAILIDIEM